MRNAAYKGTVVLGLHFLAQVIPEVLTIVLPCSVQVNTAVVGTRGVPLPVHNIIVAGEQTIPDLQKKWTRFGDNRSLRYILSLIMY